MQRSFDDLGTPLREVTFCVVDLETTGGSPVDCAITEIGAVKLRGGECLGTFQTLVNPGQAIPPQITVLTGITQAMVSPAPRIEAVLPSLLEFMAGTVVVGHNVRFDLGFLQAALARHEHPRLANPWVDTCALARRLVRDEVPNCKLGTLAERLRLPHRPNHRALDDALATADLLHLLLERAGRLGVLGLDDLLELPTVKGHPQLAKLRLTDGLPRRPGVYLFRDAAGRVLYVGKATNLRQRVRSYFSGDERRKVGQLLREACAIDHVECGGTLEAAVLEVRLIHQHQPRFNRQSKLWRRYVYLKLTLDERYPRFSVVRVPKAGDGCLYLGPLPSHAAARRVAEAVETVVPLRRCTGRPPSPPRPAPCAPAQLGVATCPCAGTISAADYATLVDRAVRGLTVDPGLLLGPLEERMVALAGQERFEEAADLRDRAAALATALARQRRVERLRRAGRVVVEMADGGAELAGGRLVRTWADGAAERGDEPTAPVDAPALPLALEPEPEPAPASGPLPRHLADEVACVAAWLEANAHRVRLRSCDGELASPLPVLPSYEPARPTRRAVPA
jgi:DNA polymerase III subunit epsilon